MLMYSRQADTRRHEMYENTNGVIRNHN